MDSARINFKNLKGFPVQAPEKKLQTEQFLQASNEIVDVIRTFGTLFTPVVNDMSGNINKILKSYEKNYNEYKFLEDLLEQTVLLKDFCTADALLWLKRGLQLICKFFENIYNDKEETSTIKHHLKDAYECTLKPYHGIIVQNTIKIIYCWVPTRNQLLGKGAEYEENMQTLRIYLPVMKSHLNHIDNLLKQYQLDKSKKV